MGYEWYVDVFFLTGFLMDTAGVFVAAVCCNHPLKIKRTLLVCGLSVICSILLFANLSNYLIYRLIIHMVVNPLMIAVIFKPKSWGRFFRLLLTVYLVLFFAGGVQESILLQTGHSGKWQILLCGLFAIAAFLIYMQRQKTMRYVCIVDLWFQNKKVTVNAYCDSGNLLRNPKNGKPVNILYREVMKHWDTKDLGIEQIPYHTISENRSYLDVITLDKMDIYMRGTLKQIKAPEIGLHAEPVMRRPPVQLLLHSSFAG